MDALAAPRAFRKSESMSQNKMRGLGIEESDSKNNMDNKNNVLSHHQEAAKPRGNKQESVTKYRNCQLWTMNLLILFSQRKWSSIQSLWRLWDKKRVIKKYYGNSKRNWNLWKRGTTRRNWLSRNNIALQ